MCIFGSGKAKRTSDRPTVYDGKGPAKKTDKNYPTVKAALTAQSKRNWEYSEGELSGPNMTFTNTVLNANRRARL